MATLIAAHHDPAIKIFCDRLVAAGKLPEAALLTYMRRR